MKQALNSGGIICVRYCVSKTGENRETRVAWFKTDSFYDFPVRNSRLRFSAQSYKHFVIVNDSVIMIGIVPKVWC